ncbi:hypothetical protein CBW65_19545 [Tumebacillus avium]|uniref:Uncharacterized protein n=1 Tax=Tumebacillus avium TaxID=1903704 RepID=A0A1Y0ISE1_9BACL|nr:hypothetical protein [Tumebacillus avium]ARU62929.1 hypothetical protein CBW65_19545 [Tumebacillus avium]
MRTIEKISCVAVFLVMLLLTAFAGSAQANGDSKEHPNNGLPIIKALTPKEVEKVFNGGFAAKGKISDKQPSKVQHQFNDGSSIEVVAGLRYQEHGVAPEADADPGDGGSGPVRDVTGYATYNAYSWTGAKMWSYSMYQDAKVDGSRVTWYEAVPYTSYWNSPVSYWHIDSEALGVGYGSSGNYSTLSTTSAKFSFGFRDFINPQTWSIKGNIIIYGTGDFIGSFTKL